MHFQNQYFSYGRAFLCYTAVIFTHEINNQTKLYIFFTILWFSMIKSTNLRPCLSLSRKHYAYQNNSLLHLVMKTTILIGYCLVAVTYRYLFSVKYCNLTLTGYKWNDTAIAFLSITIYFKRWNKSVSKFCKIGFSFWCSGWWGLFRMDMRLNMRYYWKVKKALKGSVNISFVEQK